MNKYNTYNMVDHNFRFLWGGLPDGTWDDPKLEASSAPSISLAKGLGFNSALGENHRVPGVITPQCNKKRGMYMTRDTSSVNQNQTYSPTIRSAWKSFPIQHQYYHMWVSVTGRTGASHIQVRELHNIPSPDECGCQTQSRQIGWRRKIQCQWRLQRRLRWGV